MQPQTISEFEQIAQSIRALPLEDYDRLREIINEEEQKKLTRKRESAESLERYRKADKWLAENSEKYMNQWVCLYGDELIAHGADGREVFRKAKECGIKSPFMHHIIEEPKFYAGGWE